MSLELCDVSGTFGFCGWQAGPLRISLVLLRSADDQEDWNLEALGGPASLPCSLSCS